MISQKMADAINQQIALEGYASFLYLSMASWCETQDLEGCAAFMHRQSEEERMHMLKFFHYLNEVDHHAHAPAVDKPPHDFGTIQEMFKSVYAHEQKVTKSINTLVELATTENDFATLNFLQWYVDEQLEEEALMRTILGKINLIGTGPMSLYYIDKEIEAINNQELSAEGEE